MGCWAVLAGLLVGPDHLQCCPSMARPPQSMLSQHGGCHLTLCSKCHLKVGGASACCIGGQPWNSCSGVMFQQRIDRLCVLQWIIGWTQNGMLEWVLVLNKNGGGVVSWKQFWFIENRAKGYSRGGASQWFVFWTNLCVWVMLILIGLLLEKPCRKKNRKSLKSKS